VIEVSGDAALLERPRLGGAPAPLDPGRRVVVSYRLRDVPCEVTAEVQAPADGPVRLRFTGDPIRLQRRQAVRVPVQLMVHAEPDVVPLNRPGADLAALGGITENLSATGVMLRLDRSLASGTRASLAIECGGRTGSVHVTGRVVRCHEGGTSGRGRARPYRVAFAFLDLERAQEDRLVHYLFERQRELRHRDLEHGRVRDPER
jgi:hypothetical protein